MRLNLLSENPSLHTGLSRFCSEFTVLHPQFATDFSPLYSTLPDCRYDAMVAHQHEEVRGFLPFVVYEGKFGPIINSLPYIAYGGPVSTEGDVTQILVEEMVRYARKLGCITMTVSTPPFMTEAGLAAYRDYLHPDYYFANFFQYSLLDVHPLEKLSGKRRSAFKNEIRKSEQARVLLKTICADVDIDEWLVIYGDRYAEIGATPYPPRFFKSMLTDVDHKGKVLLVGAYLEDELIGGTLFLLGRGIVDYFASAYKTSYMHLYPNTFVLDAMFHEFMAQGYRLFNWQSSPGKGGVFAYKQRWGALENEHYYLTKVTGKIENLTRVPLEDIRAAYRGFFVAPFHLWDNAK